MNSTEILTPVFVEFIPSDIEAGKLYISMTYATSVHLCASGCGHKVVLPLHPAQWRITYDGASVSMSPSVGNWALPCQSHYWIRSNRVEWAGKWDRAKIDGGRLRDLQDLDSFYTEDEGESQDGGVASRRSLLGRIFGRRR